MNADDKWYENFFTGLIVDFWRAAMPPEATHAEADFFERTLATTPGARLLDVPCGDGRLAIELARRGYRLTGVDISEEFLAAARDASSREGLEIEWRRADMRDLPWRDEFDGAFCGGSSFGFLGDEGDQEFVDAVARALAPGGRFAVDGVKAAEVILPQFRDRHDMTLGDIHFEAENRYDPETGSTENRYTVTRGRSREVKAARHRIYTYRELAAMLSRAGFSRIEGFGSLDGSPFRLGSPRLALAASRARPPAYV
ncbi:MAG TPA: methyltransferase domain-containing protein [Thermoanaerobaculia bacterium]|nr:methyltransferase domain-containing protein [Thermoanaerobaculia bacterium]